MEWNYLGILISSLLFRRIKRGKKYQVLSFYEESGAENNVIPCFFRLEDLHPGKKEIQAFVRNEDGDYILTSLPRPFVIHNRGYHYTKAAKKKIKQLQAQGTIIYNGWNRYSKLMIHELLMKNVEIQRYLPETYTLNLDNMLKLMERHRELIIKPNSGTLGKRTMKIAQGNEEKWILFYPEKNFWLEETFSGQQLPNKLKNYRSKSRFIIQERIPLAKYMGRPFDIRVSVQKNGRGEWQVTGMVGKVAKQGSFVTNVARGGTCYTLNEIIGNIPHLNYPQVYQDIERLAVMVAKELGENLSSLADIGLDIGLTNKGFPMFIECNARDLRYSFRNANLLTEWKATYKNPVSYGNYLLTLRKS